MRPHPLFTKSCDFAIGAQSIDQIPSSKLPEVAFAGRSNVGKSSLLNALTNRKSLARTSKTPGCTRQINFFNLDDALTLVDLPGYGYAKRGKDEREHWGELITDYLTGRPNLRQVCVLVDSRHGLKDTDRAIMRILDDAAVSYQVILTKCDKTPQAEIKKIVDYLSEIAVQHPALHPDVLHSSSVSKDGIVEIQERLASFV